MKNKRSYSLLLFITAVFILNAMPVFSTDNYTIIGTGISADTIKWELEYRFELYNSFFRFDTAEIIRPLNVRLFNDIGSYEHYLMLQIGRVLNGAVYLHYDKPELRELVVYSGSIDSFEFDYQSFIQYLRAYIPHPPSWLLNGFALFANMQDLQWMEQVRSLGSSMPRAREIILDDLLLPEHSLNVNNPDNFNIASLALIAFLRINNSDYRRLIYESLLILSPELTASENTSLLQRRIFNFVDMDELESDFRIFILAGLGGFQEILDEGHILFSQNRFEEAAQLYIRAMELRPYDYIPYYYLGLIAYNREDYPAAERMFLLSRERGIESSLINYALGLNALKAGRSEEGVDYLHLAAALNPADFRTRVEEVLREIWR